MKEILTVPSQAIIQKNTDFDVVMIRLLFPFEDKEENIVKASLLPLILNYKTAHFATEEALAKEKLRRNILSLNSQLVVVGTTGCILFNLAVPRPNLLKEDTFESAWELLKEVIYHPYIEDCGFDSFDLTREIENLKKEIGNSKKTLRGYFPTRVREICDTDPEKIFSRLIDNHMEQLDEVTPANLYDFYQEVIGQKKPLCFVFGNVEEKETQRLYQKYFPTKDENISLTKDYAHYLSPFRREPQYIEEVKPFKQSALVLLYKVQNMQEEDCVCLSILGSLLNSQSSSILLQKLRKEEGLVYSAGFQFYSNYGVVQLTAFIDRNKMEKAKEKMFEAIAFLKDEKKVKPLLEKVLDRKRIALERNKDSRQFLFDDFMEDYLDIRENAQKEFTKAKKITTKDIHKMVNRLCLDTIYFVKEEVKDE